MTTQEIEFGLDSPAHVSVDETGQPLNGDVVIRNTVEECVFADAVGIVHSTSASSTGPISWTLQVT
jgi:hypothetical protein